MGSIISPSTISIGQVLGEHFNLVGVNTVQEISFFAVDSLRYYLKKVHEKDSSFTSSPGNLPRNLSKRESFQISTSRRIFSGDFILIYTGDNFYVT